LLPQACQRTEKQQLQQEENNMNGQDKIWIFDTTLRDGEQALRASLSHKQKIQLAHAIARLNVDVMEVGFPVSSPGDFASVQAIAQSVKARLFVAWPAPSARISKPVVLR